MGAWSPSGGSSARGVRRPEPAQGRSRDWRITRRGASPVTAAEAVREPLRRSVGNAYAIWDCFARPPNSIHLGANGRAYIRTVYHALRPHQPLVRNPMRLIRVRPLPLL